MTTKINYHQILDSVGIPMAVISPVYDEIGDSIDFHVEFANQAIFTMTSGNFRVKQNLSKCVPEFSQKINAMIEEFYNIPQEGFYTFNFFSSVIAKKLTIIVTKAKFDWYVLIVKNPEIDKSDKNYIIRQKLSSAIIGKDFELYFQPQFCIQNDSLRGFEALIRWNDKELGSISPSCFIPIAEKSFLIIRIGWWVMEIAIKTLKIWQEKYEFKGIVSVNVSPVQLKEGNFLTKFCMLLQKYKIQPNSLEIEVTESVLIDDMEKTTQVLESIKNQNVLISLDDFGTGYSTLKYLQRLPLTTLKIDKSLIDDITLEDSVSAHITNAVVSLTKKLGIRTIAEGVECPEQLNILKLINCDVVQGFLCGKPMERGSCEKLLQNIYK